MKDRVLRHGIGPDADHRSRGKFRIIEIHRCLGGSEHRRTSRWRHADDVQVAFLPYMIVWPIACCGVKPEPGGRGFVNQNIVSFIGVRSIGITLPHLVLRALSDSRRPAISFMPSIRTAFTPITLTLRIVSSAWPTSCAVALSDCRIEGKHVRSSPRPEYAGLAAARWTKPSRPLDGEQPAAAHDQICCPCESPDRCCERS